MILKPHPWSCLPQAVATALGISFETLIEKIGHDGSEFVYKDTKFRRGFHIQECLDVALGLNVAFVPIEHHYALTPNGLETYVIGTKEEQSRRFQGYLQTTKRGFFEGVSLDSRCHTIGHAAAWVDGMIVDPRGISYTFEERTTHNFSISKFWRLIWF